LYNKRSKKRLGNLDCIGYSEIDQHAIKIYESHYPNHKNYGDITKINEKELPDFDLLVGGFPCQPFSIAGRRGGFLDTRGTLFFEIARIIRAKQPRLLLLENVKGLLSHGNGDTFYTIITALDELGYDVQWQVLNSKDFGVPQNRERVLIAGHLRGTPRPEVFPLGVGEAEHTDKTNQQGCASTLTGRSAGGGDRRGNYVVGTLRTFKDGQGLREMKNGVSPTLQVRARNDGSGQPVISKDDKIRRLTPTECERLQGFPDGWTEGASDTQRYKCLGNAVTVNVIQAVISKML
jgi:DNA (cytosine-5)-methyltransferase 1